MNQPANRAARDLKKHLNFLCFLLFVAPNPASAQTWMPTVAATANWSAIACSADGTTLVGVAPFTPVFSSTNSGATWLAGPALPYLVCLAASADGSRLVAAAYDWVHNSGLTYTSTNSGATWDPGSLSRALSLASSADGTKLVTGTTDGYMGPGSISTSTDGGAHWAGTGAPHTYWQAVASSADGTKLAAAASRLTGPFWPAVGGLIYLSADSGSTWAAGGAPSNVWYSLACSADGTRLVAGGSDAIYISVDSGATWTATSTQVPGPWYGVACSADGSRLVGANGSLILTSSDFGKSWIPNDPFPTNWVSVACSADGAKFFAAARNGGIWVSQITPSPMLNMQPSGGTLLLSWTVPSMNFTLQQNSDLRTTNWTDVTNTPTLNLTSLQNQVIMPSTGGQLFYRLKH